MDGCDEHLKIRPLGVVSASAAAPAALFLGWDGEGARRALRCAAPRRARSWARAGP